MGTVDCRKYNLYGYGERDVLWIMQVLGFFLKDTHLGIIIVIISNQP